MNLYGRFEENGYRIEAFIPDNADEPLEWTIKAYKENGLVKEIKVPMIHEPIFGVDVDDLRTLEDETDELMKSLPKIL